VVPEEKPVPPGAVGDPSEIEQMAVTAFLAGYVGSTRPASIPPAADLTKAS
jgi:hypothetical protein